MPRVTHHLWVCPFGHTNRDSFKVCSTCGFQHFQRTAQVATSERAVVFFNPATGEHRTPARNDMPVPEVYANQGFERREIMRMTDWEKESGLVHEATNFHPGNEEIPDERPIPKPKPEVIRELARDMADAIASGPFTGMENRL